MDDKKKRNTRGWDDGPVRMIAIEKSQKKKSD